MYSKKSPLIVLVITLMALFNVACGRALKTSTDANRGFTGSPFDFDIQDPANGQGLSLPTGQQPTSGGFGTSPLPQFNNTTPWDFLNQQAPQYQNQNGQNGQNGQGQQDVRNAVVPVGKYRMTIGLAKNVGQVQYQVQLPSTVVPLQGANCAPLMGMLEAITQICLEFTQVSQQPLPIQIRAVGQGINTTKTILALVIPGGKPEIRVAGQVPPVMYEQFIFSTASHPRSTKSLRPSVFEVQVAQGETPVKVDGLTLEPAFAGQVVPGPNGRFQITAGVPGPLTIVATVNGTQVKTVIPVPREGVIKFTQTSDDDFEDIDEGDIDLSSDNRAGLICSNNLPVPAVLLAGDPNGGPQPIQLAPMASNVRSAELMPVKDATFDNKRLAIIKVGAPGTLPVGAVTCRAVVLDRAGKWDRLKADVSLFDGRF